MLYKASSLITAQTVVDLVLNNTDLKDVCGYVESYQNGREQGLLIFNSQDNVYFICEHRNGDSPHVYNGSYSMQSISEDAYKNGHGFWTCQEAADWIAADLLKKAAQ
jgi:myo-inositol-hexaphosphate 3-phosphohydrolase